MTTVGHAEHIRLAAEADPWLLSRSRWGCDEETNVGRYGEGKG